MKNVSGALLVSLLLLGAGSAQAQTDTAAAPVPGPPYRTDAPQADAPCIRQVRRIAPPPSPRRFRRQWPMAAAGSILGWLVADRAVGPTGNPFVILSASTLGSIAGSHLQAASEGHPNLGRSVAGGVLGALPAGALLYMNQADTYGEREILTRGVVPAIGGALQGAVTAAATTSSLQPARTQIVECPQRPVPAGGP
ncbi:MAG TPA: hypothetical protein VF710_04415 [Longimicrobium sp.]|jgi:hypothetical protein